MQQLLKDRFEPIMSTISFSLFSSLIDYVERFEEDDHDLICHFPEDDSLSEQARLVIYAPMHEVALANLQEKVPPHYLSFLSVCGGMLLGEPGTSSQLALTPGFDGTVHAIGEDILPGYTGKECSPIDDGLDIFYFFKPEAFDRLFLWDSGMSVVTISNDPVEIYLRELHYHFHDFSKDNIFKTAQHRHTWLKEYH
jgi:hypothetical protein